MPALDGLRGVAAVVVLLDHCVRMVPAIDDAFVGPDRGRGGLVWLVSYTPLHAVWAGWEAVVVFFVLSGFVLTRSAESSRFSWRAYYPSRLLRLYLPVAAALAFAVAVFGTVSRPVHSGRSSFLRNVLQIHLMVRSTAHDLVLVKGADSLLPQLWSLKWEVIFSILLPAAAFGASRRWPVALASGLTLLILMLFGRDTPGPAGYLLYLPMFGVGALMARQHRLLARAGARLTTAVGTFVIVVALVTLTLSWTAHDQFGAVYRPFALIGAALLVFTFGYWKPMRTWGESQPLQWLGRRSFSLYLIHWPILLSSAALLGAGSRFAFVIAVPLSLVGADLFFRFVEGPSHRFSQLVRAKFAHNAATTFSEA